MVFFISLTVIALFVLWGVWSPGRLSVAANAAFEFTIDKFGWFYLLATLSLLVFSLYLAFSKYGKIRLGDDEDEPEYSNVSWFAMLFSAGMGIGLVFWGVAEPLSHYLIPPEGASGGTPQAARLAMRYSFFHWGLHPWAIYSNISLALAYFKFRKGYKGLVSATFAPLLGNKADGPIGIGIDVLAVLATVFGVATSLGLGTLQIGGGLHHLFHIPNQITTHIIIIAVVTILFLISAITGLDKGIKILSNTNLFLAAGLLLFVLLAGPTSFIFDTFTSTLGGYLQNVVQMSLRLSPFTGSTWIASWTLFYWSWWIAWAPFVGMFIARISKGRTIREFILGVLIVPSLFGLIWFSVFGSTGLKMEMFDGLDLARAVQQDMTSALFIMLEQLPLGTVLAGIATILILTFFITSADSATFVLGMLTGGGTLNPSVKLKLAWGILQSSIAVVLLLSGGLEGLQTASIVAALPFAFILVLMCFSIQKALHEDYKQICKKEREQMKKLEKILRRES